MPSPRTIREDITKEIEGVVLKVLAKEPSDRYPSAAEFTDALRDAMARVKEGELYPVAEIKREDDADLQPTIVMVGDEDLDEALTSTVAMDEALIPMDAAEMAVEDAEEVQPPIASPEEEGKDELISPISPAPEEAKAFEDILQDDEGAQISHSSTPLYILGAIAVLAIVIVLAVSGVFQTRDQVCRSIEECRERAFAAIDEGDFEGVIGHLDVAIELAAAGEHPP